MPFDKSPIYSLLMHASALGNHRRVLELLDGGEDVNQVGPRNSSALMFAASGGHLEIVKTLTERGAHLFAREDGGWTALLHAQADNYTEVVRYLEDEMSACRQERRLPKNSG